MDLHDLWPYWLATYLTVAVTGALGHLALIGLRIEVKTFWASVFTKSLAGTLLTVSAYALATTRGKSVFLGLLLIGVVYWPHLSGLRGAGTRGAHWASNQIGYLLLVPAIILCLLSARFFLANEQLVYVGGADYALYAAAADWISITGQENNNLAANLVSSSYRGLIPYHYYDLYLTKLASLPLGLLTLPSYAITSTAVGAFIVYCGILAVLERYRSAPIDWRSHAVSFLLLSGTGLTLPLYYAHPTLERLLIGSYDTPYLSSLNFARSSSSQAMILAAVLLAANGRRQLAVGSLLILPIINAVMAPAVLLGLAAISVLDHVRRRRWSIPMLLRHLAPALAVGLFLVAIYSAFGAEKALRRATILRYESYWDIVLTVAYGLKWVLRTVVFFWPFYLLAGWALRESVGLSRKARWTLRFLVLRFLTILFCGLACGSILRLNFDGIQTFSNLARECSLALAIFLWATRARLRLPSMGQRLVLAGAFSWLLAQSAIALVQYNVLDNHADGRRNQMGLAPLFLQQLSAELSRHQGSHVVLATLGPWSLYPIGGPAFGNLRNGVATIHVDFATMDSRIPGWDYQTVLSSEPFMVYLSRLGKASSVSPTDRTTERDAFLWENRISLVAYHTAGAATDRQLEKQWEHTIVDPKSGLTVSRLRVLAEPARLPQ